MKKNYGLLIAGIIILIGFGIIAIAFISQPTELQIALGLAGLALVASGYIQIAQTYNKNKDEKRNEKKHRQIMEKLEKIEQDLEKLEQPQNTGVAIADVISSGLKYYSEYMNRPKKEDEND